MSLVSSMQAALSAKRTYDQSYNNQRAAALGKERRGLKHLKRQPREQFVASLRLLLLVVTVVV